MRHRVVCSCIRDWSKRIDVRIFIELYSTLFLMPIVFEFGLSRSNSSVVTRSRMKDLLSSTDRNLQPVEKMFNGGSLLLQLCHRINLSTCRKETLQQQQHCARLDVN